MDRVLPLPFAFQHFQAIGGVLDFAVFRDADGTEDECLRAIPAILPPGTPYDADKLRSLGGRPISTEVFFGDWYNPERGLLLQAGTCTTSDGQTFENPPLLSISYLTIQSGGSPIPEPPGQFAYAFSHPPYGLFGKQSFIEVQAVFDDIRQFLLPPGQQHDILDWSHEQLPLVSPYFEPGAEWWGMFLFSLYTPSLRRLAIIAGSATD